MRAIDEQGFFRFEHICTESPNPPFQSDVCFYLQKLGSCLMFKYLVALLYDDLSCRLAVYRGELDICDRAGMSWQNACACELGAQSTLLPRINISILHVIGQQLEQVQMFDARRDDLKAVRY